MTNVDDKRAKDEADREAVLISAKAQIASSKAVLRAGRVSLDTTAETLAESRRRIADTPPRNDAPDASSPVARLQKAAKRAKDEGDLSQAEKFAQAARNLCADQDEDAFKGVLRKLAKPTKS